jgi:hypothetical protein
MLRATETWDVRLFLVGRIHIGVDQWKLKVLIEIPGECGGDDQRENSSGEAFHLDTFSFIAA